MTFIYSLFLSLIIITFLSLVFKEEAGFWLEKILYKLKGKKLTKKQGRTQKPIEKFCGFRDFSDEGGEICTLFLLDDGSEYQVSEDICRQCPVWQRYEQWLEEGKQEKISVTLIHTLHGSKPIVVESEKLNPEIDKGLEFDDFVIKRRKVPWAGKAAIAVLTLITYLMVYFSGVFSEPVVLAMPDTFYFYDVGDKAVADCWNMRTTDPSSSFDIDTKCETDTTADDNKYCILYPGVTNSTFGALPFILNKHGWMTDDDDLLNGTMPAGDFDVNIKYYWNELSDCDYSDSAIFWGLYKADSNLDNEVAIVDTKKLCDLNEGTPESTCNDTDTKLSSTVFEDEVLFIQFFWYVNFSCVKTDPNPNGLLHFYVDEGAVESLDTPTYEPIPENSIFLAAVIPFLPAIVKKFKFKGRLSKKK